MSKHAEEMFPDYILGELSRDEEAAVEGLLAHDPRSRDTLAALSDSLASLVDELPAPVLRPAARDALFSRIEGKERFSPFRDRVAALFDVSPDAAQDLLYTLDHEDGWLPGPADKITVRPVQGGPKTQGIEVVAFIRLEPGACFPQHTHAGFERVLLLCGAYRDSSGEIARRGDFVELGQEVEHHLIALDEGICIGAVLSTGNIFL